MAVSYEKERRIIHLSINEEYSYYIHINKYNYLIHLYDGKYLSDISKERVSERYMERYSFLDINRSKNEEDCYETMDEDYYFSFLASQFECASFMKGDKRGAHTIINNEIKDNIPITNFLYVSHEVIKGLPKDKNKNLPHVRFKDNEVETLIITLKEEYKDVILKLYYEVSEKYHCLVRYSKLVNNGEKEGIVVNKFSSMELDLNSCDYEILALKGTWSNDTEEERIPLNHSYTKISENHGARGFYYNPAVALIKNGTTLDNGEVYGFNILYSSDFAYEFKVDEIDQTRLTVSYNNETTEFFLNEKEELTSFETIQVFSCEGINKMSQIFHDLIRERVLGFSQNKDKYILVNSWEAYYFDFDTEKILKVIDKAKELDINLFVLDDGWFGHRNNDKSSLGDWFINKEKIDISRVVEYAKNKRMNVGLWVEPEMISPDSNLYKEHPEYALYPSFYEKPTLFRHQLVLDLTNDEVVERIFNDLTKVIDSLGISYVKWDFNRYLTETYSSHLPKEKRKETTYRFIMGTYKLLNKFTKRYPHILLESCAAGGGRFDLGLLYYSPQAWASDEMDISLRSGIQYSKNIFYPLRSIGAHVCERGSGSIQDKCCLAFFGTYGYELDILNISEEEKEKILFFNNLYQEFHDVIEYGDYYAIYNPYKCNYNAWNVVTKKKNLALVYFMIYRKEATKARFIKLKGLDKNKYYYNSLTNDIYKGDFYMNVGLNISAILTPYTSMMFVIKEIDAIKANIYRKTKQVDGGKRDKLV